MSYYKKEFDNRGFDTMFTFLQMGKQKANIPIYRKAIQDLITMMSQKNSGQITKDKKSINLEENFDMTIITIVCESVALYLSGDLDKLNINGIMYYDIAVVNIKLENNLKTPLVWGQEHLTTNPITSNFWNKYGANYTLVSNEITKEEIIEMKKNSLSKLIITVFGHLPMFVSERHLVKNYLKTFNLNDNSEINYIENGGNIYPIIDNELGTISYSAHILNGINEVLEFKKNDIDYILLNPFLVEDKFEMVLDLFNNVNKENVEDYSKKLEENFKCDNGFLNKETIYKVKKND